MVLARVKGTVVATHKSASMEGLKLLLLERIDAARLKGKGEYVVGMDSVGANVGEVVFYVTGSSARMTDTTRASPRMRRSCDGSAGAQRIWHKDREEGSKRWIKKN
jgi:microcompartment protein CcmK/EutM